MSAAREAPGSLSPHYYQDRSQFVADAAGSSGIRQGLQSLEQTGLWDNSQVRGYGKTGR